MPDSKFARVIATVAEHTADVIVERLGACGDNRHDELAHVLIGVISKHMRMVAVDAYASAAFGSRPPRPDPNLND